MRRAPLLFLAMLVLGCASDRTSLCQTSLARTQYVFHFPRDIAKLPDDRKIEWSALQEVRKQRLTNYLQSMEGGETCKVVLVRYAEGGAMSADAECDMPPRFDRPAGSWVCTDLVPRK